MKKSQAFEAVLIIILICLAGLLYLMIASSTQSAHGWEKQANDSVDYMLVGSDDALYVFSGNDVSAFSKAGDLHWQLNVPKEWKIVNSWDMPVYTQDNGGLGRTFGSYPIVEENDGNVYLLAVYALNWTDVNTAKNTSEYNIGTDYCYSFPTIPNISKPAKVMKISRDGKVAWEYPFLINLSSWDIGGLVKPEYYTMEKSIAVSVHGDRIYVYHDFTVDVLDAGGNRLFSIANASAPAAVDDAGRMYIVHAVHPTPDQFNRSVTGNYTNNGSLAVGWDNMMIAHDRTYMLTSDIVEAYGPDGHLMWSHAIGFNATRPFIEEVAWPYYNTLPLYLNGRLYVPIEDGVVAVDTDGNVIRTTHMDDGIYTLFPLMPIDSHGNIYMIKLDPEGQQSYIYTISPHGAVSHTASLYQENAYYDGGGSSLVPIGGNDGIVYAYKSCAGAYNNGLGINGEKFNAILSSKRFNADTVDAYDVVKGVKVWNFTIPPADVRVITLNRWNSLDAIGKAAPFYPGDFTSTVPLAPATQGVISVYPGQNVTYLNYYYSIYETPLFPNLSRCIYAKGIYALDNNGKLLWEKSPNGFVSNVAVGNSTIYYSLDNGRIGGTSLNIAAGAILATFAYLFLRFFMMGTVARARSRIDKNENRNRVLKYIVDNPGSTLRDAARGTGVNLGTVRYHVFILGLNHRIISYMADDKHVRYFTNAGSYSKEEQLVISLMKRDGVRKILELLTDKPGLTNLELSHKLDIQESAASRYMKELADKGIVARENTRDGRFAYTIKNEYVKAVSLASDLQ